MTRRDTLVLKEQYRVLKESWDIVDSLLTQLTNEAFDLAVAIETIGKELKKRGGDGD